MRDLLRDLTVAVVTGLTFVFWVGIGFALPLSWCWIILKVLRFDLSLWERILLWLLFFDCAFTMLERLFRAFKVLYQ